MTREEIIRMALEADLDPYDMCADPRIAENDLVNFANLIAAAEREKNYALIETLIEAEREACAKVCEDDGMLWGSRYAAKIRARGEK